MPQQPSRARPSARYAVDASQPGFKTFRCARALIPGIENMHMIKKGPLDAIKHRSSRFVFS
jgi:hypothetical protein